MGVTKDATQSHVAADEVLKDPNTLLEQAKRMQSEILAFLDRIKQE